RMSVPGADVLGEMLVDEELSRPIKPRTPLLRSIATHGGLYAAINAGSILVGLLVLPLYARALPPEAFGAQDLVLLLVTLTTLVAPLEIAQGLARQYVEVNSQDERKRLASTALWFTLGQEALAAVLLTIAGPLLSPWSLGPWSGPSLWLAVVGFAVAHGLYTLLLSQLRWRLQPARYCGAVLTQTALVNGLGLCLTVLLGWSLPGIIVAYAGGYGAAAVVTFSLGRADYTLRADRGSLGKMLRFSFPLVPSSVAVLLYSYADRLVIRQSLTLDAVGHYSMLTRFAGLEKPLILAAAMALTPLVMSRYGDPDTRQDVARFCRYLWAGVLAAAILMAAFGPEVIAALATTVYSGDAPLLPLLAFAFALAELYIVAPGLFIARKTQIIATINIGSAVLNLLLNFFLVPRYGLLGACIGTTLSATTALALNVLLAQKHYPIPYPWRALMGSTVVAIIVSASAVEAGMAWPLWDYMSLGIRTLLAMTGIVGVVILLLGNELYAISRGLQRTV
ncbi:MAG: polysaccharide biosynthesis C-terminal domain-containing protein, partial [Chloroflexi bacterium]|nr:polysaccharide biosynthesis C-terminal domain-containing protein [Chloroflexota bacterium]